MLKAKCVDVNRFGHEYPQHSKTQIRHQHTQHVTNSKLPTSQCH